MTRNTILQCPGLSKSCGKTPALTDVSFTMAPGTIAGLLGPIGRYLSSMIKAGKRPALSGFYHARSLSYPLRMGWRMTVFNFSGAVRRASDR